MVAEFIH